MWFVLFFFLTKDREGIEREEGENLIPRLNQHYCPTCGLIVLLQSHVMDYSCIFQQISVSVFKNNVCLCPTTVDGIKVIIYIRR